jgi:hypothetical protein
VLGTVVNDVKKKSRYGYYSGYGYYHSYYGYGRDRKKRTHDRKAVVVGGEFENFTDSHDSR